MLWEAGFSVVGVDPSEEGIMHGRHAFPHLSLHVGSCYEPLAERFGTFPLVISLEVIEHCFYPRQFAKCVYDLLEPGGTAVISTPYHGYIKNLALALSGKLDAHFTALWEGGHIKFWSVATLRKLLEEAGFSQIQFFRAGRFPPMAKSMIAMASARKLIL
jgi:2-polyprenyl-3-methyl-5-hydroxy-6-metoxy-1,4-benzoquinol methylase